MARYKSGSFNRFSDLLLEETSHSNLINVQVKHCLGCALS